MTSTQSGVVKLPEAAERPPPYDERNLIEGCGGTVTVPSNLAPVPKPTPRR